MKLRQAKRAALVLGCICTAGLGAGYTWTDRDESSHDWHVNENWARLGFCTSKCYPHSANDDATIPSSEEAPWTVDLVTVTIDDLTISDTVAFGTAQVLDPTLTVESLTINGPATVTIDYATIVAANQ